ncbi:putative surface protein with fasciclin (FAS1) repeats [Friedmanniella endophytica]|uniref:Putative surface protein with fasciclin (FAS1) repeats n=1 Tax=Microlunatus kandeliicorticis TaxID=1759536 RepID=A0A7W3IQL2_9ACTN|nr:fasciclin domain-containing protein [Microlunatus kandeliicorticis]MBA8793436.1 putative surface protein with fasciclin (FAS1) repeats [Microlunatus kandeliicorticis]
MSVFSITRSRVGKIAAVSVLGLVPLSLAACGSDSTTAGSPASSAPMTSAPMSSPSMSPSMSPSESPSMSPSMSSSMASQPFGSACSAVPKSGKGSFDGMSQDPVATAASNNPVLSTLVKAVTAAKLGDTLNNAKNITVFAPTNDAFKKVPSKTLNAAMKDPSGLLTDVLTAHVVPERLSPDQLAGTHDTLNKNQKITVTGSGESFKVNGEAMVVCGNVQTANATVYIIDHVLLPKS